MPLSTRRSRGLLRDYEPSYGPSFEALLEPGLNWNLQIRFPGSSSSPAAVAANNSIRWNVLSQREQNITKIIGRLKYSNQILLYPWKHRYIISMETQSRVQSHIYSFSTSWCDSKLKLQEEKECRLPLAKPYDEYCKAEIMKTLWGWRYYLTSTLVLVLDEAIISKVLPEANIRAAARVVNTHFSSPGRHGGGAGLGWTNGSVNLWPASLPRDRISYPPVTL